MPRKNKKKDKLNHIADFREFVSNNQNMEVAITSDVTYNLTDTIREEYRLFNAMFKSTPITEPSGFRNVFMRKAWVVYRTLIQGSDVDLRNLDTKPLQLSKVRVVAFLRMLFISKLARINFGDKMDDIVAYFCWHGSAVVKRHEYGVDLVDLRNYLTEANEQDPQKRRHSEAKYYTYSQMEEYKDDWAENWKDVEELYEVMKTQGVSQFRVLIYSTWGKIEEGDETKKICVKFLDNTIVNWAEDQTSDSWTPQVQLDSFVYSEVLNSVTEEKEPMFPYTQFDLFRVSGRWKALGCGELLGGPSEMYNELFNGKRKLDRKALMGIMVHHATVDANGNQSVMSQENITGMSTWTIITLSQDEKLENLHVDPKSGDFNLMEGKIYELMLQIIGITAQGTGEEAPASTSATQAAINKQTANTVFDYVRERFHHGIDKLFNLGYANDILESLSQKEIVSITGDPSKLAQFDSFLVDNAINNWVIETKKKTGFYPTEEQIFEEKKRLKEEMKELGDSRFPAIKKEMLTNLPYLIKFGTQQEAFNTKFRSDAIIALLQDPNNTTMSKAKLRDVLVTDQGLDPDDFRKSIEELEAEKQAQVEAQQQAMQQAQGKEQAMQPPEPVM